jgi:hypothetical protein
LVGSNGGQRKGEGLQRGEEVIAQAMREVDLGVYLGRVLLELGRVEE